MIFEVGKYFYLTANVGRSKKGIYLVDEVILNHYADWGNGRKSQTSATRIFAHNVETNSKCDFDSGSSVAYWCSPHIRDYNLDKLLNDTI